MKNEDKIFIFTTIYNGKVYLDDFIKGFLGQTSNSFIHFIYNDGSTDDIDQKIEEYKQLASNRKKPFNVIYEKCYINKGNDYGTEHCIKKCLEYSLIDKELTYFMWVNADDIPIKNMVNNILKYSKYSYSVINLKRKNLFGKKLKHHYVPRMKIHPFEEVLALERFYWSVFAIKISTFINVNPKGIIIPYKINAIPNDNQVLLEVFSQTDSYKYVRKASVIKRVHNNNLLRTIVNLNKNYIDFFSNENLYFSDETIDRYKILSHCLDIRRNISTSFHEKKYEEVISCYKNLIEYLRASNINGGYFITKHKAQVMVLISLFILIKRKLFVNI